ncbi:MAG: hypothetical protein KC549_17965 [Myxococcales bacterium]|nr:hypothetical protein [Myxococcales bacterium]MCB9548306.1 hypothetical protein [Myxococcales bacterium]
MVARSLLVLGLAALAGCLRTPELRDCAEFPVTENPDACGSPCDIYCDVLVDACPDQVGGEDKARACRSSCIEIDAGGEFNAARGNNLQCRIREAVLAWDDPSHCASAGFSGGDVCQSTQCDEYCGLMIANCTSMYQDLAQCMSTCALFPTGGSASSGNNVECRAAAARDAGENASRCAAASLTSDGTCGSACDGYCTQVMAHCSTDPVVFDSLDTCLSTCALMPTGPFDDWRNGGDSVQCRAWHASTPAELDPVTHCAHASLYNDDHCGGICSTWCFVCGSQFDNEEACMAECTTLVSDGAPLFPDPAAARQCTP